MFGEIQVWEVGQAGAGFDVSGQDLLKQKKWHVHTKTNEQST